MVRTDLGAAAEGSAGEAPLRRVQRRRHRLVAGALAVILVAGPAIGSAVVRALEDHPSVLAKDLDVRPSSTTAPAASASPAAPPLPVKDDPIGTPGSLPCGYLGYFLADTGSGLECEPLEALFRRDGVVVVRAYRSAENTTSAWDLGWWGPGGGPPPPECFPERYVSAGLSTDDVVGIAGGPLYAEPFEPIVANHGFFGVGEGSPVAWAVVQASPDVAQVRVDFEAGGDDTMEPVDGVAVLAASVPATDPGAVPPSGGTAEALDASGEVVASGELVTGQIVEDEVLSRPECRPEPPALPEADGPPPENEEAARQAVIEAYNAVYSSEMPEEVQAANVDDPSGLPEAVAIGKANFPDAFQVVSVRVHEVKFLNPTSAAVRYDIVLPGYSIPEFPDHIGRAVLTDGEWKVTRETICSDLGLAGATCDPSP